jgi:hypothetical protein
MGHLPSTLRGWRVESSAEVFPTRSGSISAETDENEAADGQLQDIVTWADLTPHVRGQTWPRRE